LKLIIDVGNTRLKAAVFNGSEMLEAFVFDNTVKLITSDLFTKYNISNCIVASVKSGIEDFVNQLKQETHTLLFSAETPVPIKNLYVSVTTLGRDRLAAAVGGSFLFPNKNVLVIDAGTCLKYNFVNDKSEFLGGAISPGLKMRFKALNTFTARLPLIEMDADFDKPVGGTTSESILSGIVLGTLAEVEGMIEQYKALYNNLTVVITGGDVYFFEKRLKNSIFADQYLILKGLNLILEHNINAKT
jgi:type III pantothenate kinase